MRFAAALTTGALVAAVSLPTAVAAAANDSPASGLVRGCVNVKTRALTIPAGTVGCGSGTAGLSWQATGPAGPAGIPGWGLDVSGTGHEVFFIALAFDGQNLWAADYFDNSVD